MEITKIQDIKALQKIAEATSAARILSAYGASGFQKFKLLLEFIPNIISSINIEDIDKLNILLSVGENTIFSQTDNDIIIIHDYEQLSDVQSRTITVELTNTFSLLVKQDPNFDEMTIANDAIVYTYTSFGEYFIEIDKRLELVPLPGCQSYFTIKTFKAIDEALNQYSTTKAKMSTCRILVNAWNEQERIFFKTKPEYVMRDSLTQFLDDFLRGSKEVRAEQNMDESHPVDIKVTWNNSSHIAIIEVKWLGKSIAHDRSSFTSTYSDKRARDGADQLVGYLDSNKVRAPSHITKAYLVVFDARRKGTNLSTTSVNIKNGMHYQNQSIAFNPQYELHRDDYKKPVRIFLEPVCTKYP